MRAYTHGGGAHRQRVSTIFFDSEKLSQIFLELLTQTGFELRVFRSRVRRSTNLDTTYGLQ